MVVVSVEFVLMLVTAFVIQPPLGVKAPPVNGNWTSGRVTFMSLAEKPVSAPLLPAACQARSPTDPLLPMEAVPLGPVEILPKILALPTFSELVNWESVATSPWASCQGA